MHRNRIALLALAPVVAAACVHNFRLRPGPVQLYDGAALPAESVAVLENARNMYIESVDHRSLRRFSLTEDYVDVVQVQVLPGHHTFVAGPAERSGFVSNTSLEVSFLAEAGHHYRVSRHMTGGQAPGWEIVLTDATTGRQLMPLGQLPLPAR